MITWRKATGRLSNIVILSLGLEGMFDSYRGALGHVTFAMGDTLQGTHHHRNLSRLQRAS
jgi:hypothetical protein